MVATSRVRTSRRGSITLVITLVAVTGCGDAPDGEASVDTESVSGTTVEPPTASAVPTDSVEPGEFLDEVLEVVESNAYYADRVDWNDWANDAEVAASAAESTESTYRFVRELVAALDDDHSRFVTPDEVARILEPGAQSTPEQRRPSGEVDQRGIGYLAVPGFGVVDMSSTAVTEYVEAAYDVLRQPACGWIVDLAGNQGGSLYPMLAALAPILGPGEAMGYTSRDGVAETFEVTDNGSIIGYFAAPAAEGGVELVTALTTFPGFISPDSHVAVLQGPRTASSGEAALIALRGRAATTFGRSTAGVPTGNAFQFLSDGSAINLTTGVGTEPGGFSYATEIPPDVELPPGRSSAREDATQWLQQSAGC